MSFVLTTCFCFWKDMIKIWSFVTVGFRGIRFKWMFAFNWLFGSMAAVFYFVFLIWSLFCCFLLYLEIWKGEKKRKLFDWSCGKKIAVHCFSVSCAARIAVRAVTWRLFVSFSATQCVKYHTGNSWLCARFRCWRFHFLLNVWGYKGDDSWPFPVDWRGFPRCWPSEAPLAAGRITHLFLWFFWFFSFILRWMCCSVRDFFNRDFFLASFVLSHADLRAFFYLFSSFTFYIFEWKIVIFFCIGSSMGAFFYFLYVWWAYVIFYVCPEEEAFLIPFLVVLSFFLHFSTFKPVVFCVGLTERSRGGMDGWNLL